MANDPCDCNACDLCCVDSTCLVRCNCVLTGSHWTVVNSGSYNCDELRDGTINCDCGGSLVLEIESGLFPRVDARLILG
jgi:hypothetical protein